MSIFVARHGQTALNISGIVQPPDTPLDETGLQQADCLARRLADMGVTRLVTSDLPRAHMTATAIAEHGGLHIEVDPLLRERDFGALCGKHYTELDGNIFAPDYVPPEGESWKVFHSRVERAWQNVTRLAENEQGAVVVVTHGLVCTSLALRCLHVPDRNQLPIRWANTSLTRCARHAPYPVDLINCTAHLEEIAVDSKAM